MTDTGAELRFVATVAERQDLSLNLDRKFDALDGIVSSIEVRNADAKRPHEIQDKKIFLGKLRGSEDDVNGKLRSEMRRWLANAAAGVVQRLRPDRPPLSLAELEAEGSAELVAQAVQLERRPRLPVIYQTAGLLMPVLGLSLASLVPQDWCQHDGPMAVGLRMVRCVTVQVLGVLVPLSGGPMFICKFTSNPPFACDV